VSVAAPLGPEPLVVEGLVKRFAEQTVLDGVSLTVGPSEVVALLGPNGAGKTTLLRVVAGLVSADAGQVVVAGHDVQRDGSRSGARVGWALGDEHSWYWRLSGRVNLIVFARLMGTPRSEAEETAGALLSELGLGAAADRPVAAYSTGMKARLGLARARIAAPDLVILDEASRGLDAVAEEHFAEWLRRRERHGTLMVTHTLQEAAEVADRTLILAGGRVVEELGPGVSVAELGAAVRRGA
jgi:ABC-type multidrug transport system ATPase subunit